MTSSSTNSDVRPRVIEVEQLALQRLSKCAAYAHYFRAVNIEFDQGMLILTGRVPTFYMKQILQTLLRGVDGVTQIDNSVDVVDQTGLRHRPTATPSSVLIG